MFRKQFLKLSNDFLFQIDKHQKHQTGEPSEMFGYPASVVCYFEIFSYFQ